MLLWHTVQACMHTTNTNTHTPTTSLYVTCLPLSFLARYKHESHLWPGPMSFLARYMPVFRIQTQTQRPSQQLFSQPVCPLPSWPGTRLSRMPTYVSLFHTSFDPFRNFVICRVACARRCDFYITTCCKVQWHLGMSPIPRVSKSHQHHARTISLCLRGYTNFWEEINFSSV